MDEIREKAGVLVDGLEGSIEVFQRVKYEVTNDDAPEVVLNDVLVRLQTVIRELEGAYAEAVLLTYPTPMSLAECQDCLQSVMVCLKGASTTISPLCDVLPDVYDELMGEVRRLWAFYDELYDVMGSFEEAIFTDFNPREFVTGQLREMLADIWSTRWKDKVTELVGPERMEAYGTTYHETVMARLDELVTTR